MPSPNISHDHQPPRQERRAMTKHMTGTRKEWLAARLELLKAEKELTRRGDELARRRQELPWVRIDKEYRFETDAGSASLADLFRERSQLLVYHYMFGPEYTAGCATCSTIADGFDGYVVHLANHDVTLLAVSRAPLAKLQAYKRRMGWTFPWASSVGGEFNFDFSASFTEQQQREGIEYNYRREAAWRQRSNEGIATRMTGDPVGDNAAMTGTDAATYTRERPGMSAFALEDGVVYHTYSAYARGLDALWGMYPWLDRAPKGRNETGVWWRRQRGGYDRLVRVHVGDGRDDDTRRLDDVDGVDACRTDVVRRRGVVPRHVGRDDGGDDAAVLGPDAVALPPGRWQHWRDAPRPADRARGHGLLLRLDRVRNGRVSAGRRAGDDRDAAAGAGARRTHRGRCGRPDRQPPPAHRVEGASPYLVPGSTRARPYPAGRRRHGLATRPAPRPSLYPLLCRAHGDPLGHRGHGPSRDGCRRGRHHRRTSRTGR